MPLRASSHPGAPIPPVVLPLHGTVVGRDYLPEASPGSEPGSLARQRWHATATPLSQYNQRIPCQWNWKFLLTIMKYHVKVGKFARVWTRVLTLNSICGPFRPKNNFACTQHWYLGKLTPKTVCISHSHLSEWCKPIKILKVHLTLRYIEVKKFLPNQHSRASEVRWSLIM